MTNNEIGQKNEYGEWEDVEYRFNNLPIHTALLHTGKVLAFGGSGNDETRLENPYPAELFDPKTGTVEKVDQELAGDIFCAGHSFLSDGKLLVAGGTDSYDGDILDIFNLPGFPMFGGLDQAYLFDPVSENWTRVSDMDVGRWYPTLVTMGDGSVVTAAGLTKHFPWVTLRKIEKYTTEKGWDTIKGVGRWLPLYPRLHLLPDGKIFYAGSYNSHYTFPFSLKAFPTAVLDIETGRWTDYSLPKEAERQEGASVLLPFRPQDGYDARVLLCGGGTPGGSKATADTEIINLSVENPKWRSTENMRFARYYTYAVLLPDGNIFVAGGRSGSRGHIDDMEYDELSGAVPSHPNAIHEAELFNPDTESWETLASMEVDRLYHSGALLLPDGRVMMSGSNPKRRVNELRIETYKPPYLFKGPRPSIGDLPDVISYGDKFDIETSNSIEIDEVVLIRQCSTTHCLTTDQRLVELPIQDKGNNFVSTAIPDNPNLLPPAYYMLFILRDGVPSIGKFIHVHHKKNV